jgi:uracil-DNA glycosylase family 4
MRCPERELFMLLFSSSVRRQVSLKTSRDILSAGVPDQFLNALFQRCGLKQSELFITSSVKCRPPHDRPPRDEELQTCYSYWLQRQIEIIDPKVIVLSGKIPCSKF